MKLPPAPEHPLVVGSAGLLWVALAALVWIYTYRVAENPPKWEEPRRCLVAMEMIHRGDYVVPRLFGEPYLNKPPLQSWLIALYSGNRFERVGPLAARLVSLTALVGTCALLWRLGLSASGRADPTPALVFLTLGEVVQFGRAGEIDMLFCFLITAAVASVELGRRRASPVLRWVVSQALLGAGVLTKGIAPLFFYPPVVGLFLRRPARTRANAVAAAAGAVIALIIVAAWLVPYADMAPAAPLRERWLSEILRRTLDQGPLLWLRHVATYPLQVLGATLPWSLVLVALDRGGARRVWESVRGDPYLRLCAAVAGWGALLFLFVPLMKGRYLLPLMPFASVLVAVLLRELPRSGGGRGTLLRRIVRHRTFWAAVVALTVAGPLVGRAAWLERYRGLAWLALAVGLAVVAAFAHAVFRRGDRSPGLPLLVLGLVYGVIFAGVAELKAAEQNARLRDAAVELSPAIEPGVPVIVGRGVDRGLSFELSHLLARPLRSSSPEEGPYYLVAPSGGGAPPTARAVTTAGRYVLYRIDSPARASPPPRPVRRNRAAAPAPRPRSSAGPGYHGSFEAAARGREARVR